MTEILERVPAPALPSVLTLSPLQAILDRGRVRAAVAMLGPAFVAAIAYVDPGNFATNFQGGALFGYRLLWVVAAANAIAIPIQYLSAKLGIVTGRSLPQLCGQLLPRPVAALLWLQAERRQLLRFERFDVVVALGLAGLVNMAMLAVAAKLLHRTGFAAADVTLPSIHRDLAVAVGGGAALIFAAALLASGISSSSTGTCAGQIIMKGFVRRSIPASARRLITMAPAVVLLCTHIDPIRALVLSQVALSFGIPFALAPLLVLTGSRKVMGAHANASATTACVTLITAGLVALNMWLLAQQFG